MKELPPLVVNQHVPCCGCWTFGNRNCCDCACHDKVRQCCPPCRHDIGQREEECKCRCHVPEEKEKVNTVFHRLIRMKHPDAEKIITGLQNKLSRYRGNHHYRYAMREWRKMPY